MRTILIHPDVKGAEDFREIISNILVDFQVVNSVDQIDISDVEVVIIWLSVPIFLSELINLKLILSCGSGVDQIVTSPTLPRNIPLIRIVDPFLANHVSDYVVEQVLNCFFPEQSREKQTQALCRHLDDIKLSRPKIGILGLGIIGCSTAEKLINMGFEVCGWVRSFKRRSVENVFVGEVGLSGFAANCDVVICHLPLTKETNGILNSYLFSILPNNAFLINVGRGAHLVESDLLVALDAGEISGACLDVFEVEPLSSSHPFHSNLKIKTTPHIAGYVSPETQAPYAAKLISNYYNDEKVTGVVDYSLLY